MPKVDPTFFDTLEVRQIAGVLWHLHARQFPNSPAAFSAAMLELSARMSHEVGIMAKPDWFALTRAAWSRRTLKLETGPRAAPKVGFFKRMVLGK